MDADDLFPKKANDLLAVLGKEDLDPLSVGELNQRIAVLEMEILRTKAKISQSVNHLASAESLFKR
jgi:Uncharacterized small protein containing a coiled-coil domain